MEKRTDALRTMISVRISPRSSRSEVTGFKQDVLYVKVAAPPVEGKANSELIVILSKRLSIPRDSLEIVRGHTSKNKVVSVKGLTGEEIMRRLIPG